MASVGPRFIGPPASIVRQVAARYPTAWARLTGDLTRALAVAPSVTFVNWYRSPAHNLSVPGSRAKSQHQIGTAIDVAYNPAGRAFARALALAGWTVIDEHDAPGGPHWHAQLFPRNPF